ncbi:ABC-type dipeptide/oligopeptide/nickel transport system, ATPase component [Antarctobacter heliothermus]|uniref:ABC-type dipeptide/oligopeptide/nickel transport system, ATPase component n=1 Tax=Antarctobacter heliothermus TaxID=74033 RepID=A0A239JQA7_9RHOB|nr:ABC-type dipeptide/oligopeptide/nickel transport system, ATPase component [Antarctobacter heliothermus]
MLTVENLTVQFPGRHGTFTAVEDVSLSIAPGEIHGLVGESGAGKSTIGAAIIGLLQPPGFVAGGTLHLGDTDLRSLTPTQAHAMRGARISMIFQDPQTSLNPLMTIDDQLIETIQAHENVSSSEARTRAVDLLEEIGIENAAKRIKAYPHQFSGGMRQRVVIALALCTNPELIIADEPTTALDVAVQSQVLDLIRRLAQTRDIGFLLITHDIGVIAQITDNVTVLRGGKVMETGPTDKVLKAPEHPLHAIPDGCGAPAGPQAGPLSGPRQRQARHCRPRREIRRRCRGLAAWR